MAIWPDISMLRRIKPSAKWWSRAPVPTLPLSGPRSRPSPTAPQLAPIGGKNENSPEVSFGALAQLVERRPEKAGVGGPIPPGTTALHIPLTLVEFRRGGMIPAFLTAAVLLILVIGAFTGTMVARTVRPWWARAVVGVVILAVFTASEVASLNFVQGAINTPMNTTSTRYYKPFVPLTDPPLSPEITVPFGFGTSTLMLPPAVTLPRAPTTTTTAPTTTTATVPATTSVPPTTSTTVAGTTTVP